MIFALSLALLAVAVSSKIEPSKDKVKMVIELTRHGHRAPLEKVFHRDWIDQTGPGEISIMGMRQRYNLGR